MARGTTQRGLTNQYRPLRNLAVVDLLFATGMRVGEVSGLNLEDFGVAESVFRVKGKGGRDRLAFLVVMLSSPTIFLTLDLMLSMSANYKQRLRRELSKS